MTNLYFVRHSKVIYTKADHIRPLSDEGKAAVKKVTDFFRNIHIDKMISSPYIRAIDTIKGVAEEKGLEIECYDDLRERKVADGFIDDFESFAVNQWTDFDYKLEGGESFNEVFERGNIVLSDILTHHSEKNIIVGTHGTFLGIQLNHYNPDFDIEDWKKIKMPDIFQFCFDGSQLISVKNHKL